MEKTRGKKSDLESAQIVDNLQRKQIEAFRKETAIEVAQKIISSATDKNFMNGKVNIVGWELFLFLRMFQIAWS